jgi:hypothetical protein
MKYCKNYVSKFKMELKKTPLSKWPAGSFITSSQGLNCKTAFSGPPLIDLPFPIKRKFLDKKAIKLWINKKTSSF